MAPFLLACFPLSLVRSVKKTTTKEINRRLHRWPPGSFSYHGVLL